MSKRTVSGTTESWFDVVVEGKVDKVNQYLEKFGDRFIHERDPGWFGATATLYAARFGHIDTLNILVEHGGDINAVNKFGDTCLHYATYWNHFDCVKRLIELGAKRNMGNKKKGRSALHWASAHGFLDIANYLIKNGSDPNFKDFDGDTPLDIARQQEMKELLSEKSIIRMSVLRGSVVVRCKDAKLSVSRVHLNRSKYLKAMTSSANQAGIIEIDAITIDSKIVEIVLQWFGGCDGNIRSDRLGKVDSLVLLELCKKWELMDLHMFCLFNVVLNTATEEEVLKMYESDPNNKVLQKYIQDHYVRILGRSEKYLAERVGLLFSIAKLPTKVIEIEVIDGKSAFETFVQKDLYRQKEKTGNGVAISKEGKKFKFHREVFRIKSPFFSQLLDATSQSEGKDEDIVMLEMKDFNGEEVRVMIDYIYLRKVKTTDISCLFKIMKIHLTNDSEADFLRKIGDTVSQNNFFEVIRNMKILQMKGIWLENHKEILRKLIQKFEKLNPMETIHFMLE